MASGPIISWQIDGKIMETVRDLIFQFSSVAQSCPTLCDPMNHSMPGLPVHHQLPEFTQTHIYRVCDAIQPSHPGSSPSPPAPNPSQHQSFPMSQLFAWGGQSTGVSALASFLPKKSPSEWTGWISLQSKGLSRVFSNTTIRKHQFFGAQLSLLFNSHIHTWPLEKPKLWLDGPLLAPLTKDQWKKQWEVENYLIADLLFNTKWGNLGKF